jgi:hypothetical protein
MSPTCESRLVFPCITSVHPSGVIRIGAVYGNRFSIWDLSNLRGGKPFVTGSTFTEGGQRFRSVQLIW